MNAVLNHYVTEATNRDGVLPGLSSLKQTALHDMMQLGFPTRRDEAWKYTSTASFNQHLFASDKPLLGDVGETSLPFDVIECDASGEKLTGLEALPNDVLVMPWSDALRLHADKVLPYLGKIAAHTHGFNAQNTLMLRDGLFIYLPHGVCLSKPLYLNHGRTSRVEARYFRHLIVAEPGAKAIIIEDHVGSSTDVYYRNVITEIQMHEHSSLQHYKIQREGDAAFHVGQLSVHQAAFSQLETHSFSFGGQWVRSDTLVDLHAHHATCSMNGIYITAHKQHLDHHTMIKHHQPMCESSQDYRGIMGGASRAVFNGQVWVVAGADGTSARQYNKNLLLSSRAEIDTKPELMIFADDVQCSHGATVGQLDEDALFYLGTRGLDEDDSRAFLLDAFVAENLTKIAFSPLASWLHGLLAPYLRMNYA